VNRPSFVKILVLCWIICNSVLIFLGAIFLILVLENMLETNGLKLGRWKGVVSALFCYTLVAGSIAIHFQPDAHLKLSRQRFMRKQKQEKRKRTGKDRHLD
jgi:hypothetical protein